MYNLNDNSYNEQPNLMSYDVADNVLKKAYINCIENSVNEFLFVFHGGEPLMHKKEFLEYFILSAKKIFPKTIKLYFAIQSN